MAWELDLCVQQSSARSLTFLLSELIENFALTALGDSSAGADICEQHNGQFTESISTWKLPLWATS